MIETKQKILDTAESLFAEKGYDATSLREIISAAGVNLAAIHYHFGSKEDLLDELIRRKVGPVNQTRTAMLDRVEAAAGAGALTLERVLEAFLMPMSDVSQKSPQFVRLMGRIHAEGLLPAVRERHFQEIIVRFIPAFRRALPELPEGELGWRLHFMIGAMAHAMCVPPALETTAPLDMRGRLEHLIAFLSGGFRAPVPQSSPVEESVEVTQ